MKTILATKSQTPVNLISQTARSAIQSASKTPQERRAVLHRTALNRHGVVARVASLETEQAADAILEVSGIPQEEKAPFDWERQWYALAFVKYLDPEIPHPKELLEGRIEPSDGTLMCSYHGWRFDGEGKCTDIPQSLDPKANAAACSNPRSCAISRPTKVLQGKIFVWGKSSPNAAAEAAAVPVPGVPDMAMTEDIPLSTSQGVPTVALLSDYYRELPYGWEVLAENLMDPSHLPFAHHGVLNRRDDEKAGYYRMDIRRAKDSSSGQDVISVAGESIRPRMGDLQGRAFQFNPPSLIRWYTYQREKGDVEDHKTWININVFYVIPVAPGKSAVLFSGFFTAEGAQKMPLIAQLIFKYRPRWESHCFTHLVFDGDSKILHMQERLLAETSRNGESSWRKNYYMPAQADRLVAAFRKWLDERGGGGPPTRLPAQLPPLDDRQEVYLDRYDTHTRHCPSCLGAVKRFERLRIAAVAAGVFCLLGLSSALGRGLKPLSPIPLAIAAGALVCLAACLVVGRLLKRFFFVGYNHSEK
ncbi:hypothetical protein WJX75_001402 [Coccomyxa subellipsoidea]|uniref:Rieske domain-containing protein n=1 Tax=Coccomyxa subellipsoidea TaxID=248742 RepID=A0ABR2YNX7_9CHLO